MRKRFRPTAILTTVSSLLLIFWAGLIIRQPQTPSFNSPPFFSTVTSAVTDSAPPSTPVVRFAPGSRVAGVDVGGRTVGEASALVEHMMGMLKEPLPLVEDVRFPDRDAPLLDLKSLGLEADVQRLIDAAVEQASNGDPVNVPLQLAIDREQLREAVAALAPYFEQPAAQETTISEDDPPRVTFHVRTHHVLDVETTATLIENILSDPSQPFTRTAALRTEGSHGSLAELETALRQQLKAWDGVAAIAVYDLKTDEWLTINADTVFSGASVMKVPIMVYAYAKLGELNAEQRTWIEAMIINSSNSTANSLLAAGAGGQGTEAALRGAHEMTAMLRELGLEYSYQIVPYGASEELRRRILSSHQEYIRDGTEPLTKADRFMRTTPREMTSFFTMLVQCSQGEGPLLQYRDGAITQDECIEMMGWLGRPHDQQRLMAGIPQGVKVAHKAGWLLDMQSDVGVVYSPNGTYIVAIYLWRDGLVSNADATPSPYLGALSHTIYTFYNPEPLERE